MSSSKRNNKNKGHKVFTNSYLQLNLPLFTFILNSIFVYPAQKQKPLFFRLSLEL